MTRKKAAILKRLDAAIAKTSTRSRGRMSARKSAALAKIDRATVGIRACLAAEKAR